MSYLGIDIGTTGCKAGVFDARGRLLALAYREYPVLAPEPGWAELDSARVIDACLEAIREAAAATDDPVAGMGISSQGEAFTPVADGRPYAGPRDGLVRRPGGGDGRPVERAFRPPAALPDHRPHAPSAVHALQTALAPRSISPTCSPRRTSSTASRTCCTPGWGLSRRSRGPWRAGPCCSTFARTAGRRKSSASWTSTAERLARPVASGTVVGTHSGRDRPGTGACPRE